MRLADICKGVEIGGRFRLVDILGQGSYGVVWLADVIKAGDALPTQVALKIFQQQDRADAALFREAQTARPFNHAALVKVFGCARVDGLAVMWMEYVTGKSLQENIGDERAPRPVSVETVLAWLRDIANGLAYLHSQKPPIIHGDLKLDNILLDDEGGARLTDFGQSRRIEDRYIATAGGGGFLYLAPEVFGAEDKQGTRCVQTDIYAFGVLAYRLLCGRFPYENTTQLINRVPFPRPRDLNPSIPDDINQVVMKCLEKRPRDRFPSGVELLAAIDAFARKAASPAPKPAPMPAPPRVVLRTPADELADIAGAQLEAGKVEEVVTELEKAVQHMSTSPKVLLIYAAASKQTHNLDVARAVYLRVIRWMEANGWSEQEQQEAYEGLADVTVRLKKYEESVKAFAWLHDRWPRKDWYRYRLGIALGLAGRYRKSVEILQPLHEAEPSALVCGKIGFALNQLREIDLACQYFNEALMLDPYESTALSCLVEIRAIQGQSDKARAYLDRLRKVEGADDMVARLERRLALRP